MLHAKARWQGPSRGLWFPQRSHHYFVKAGKCAFGANVTGCNAPGPVAILGIVWLSVSSAKCSCHVLRTRASIVTSCNVGDAARNTLDSSRVWFRINFWSLNIQKLLTVARFFTLYPDIRLQDPHMESWPMAYNLCPKSLSWGYLFTVYVLRHAALSQTSNRERAFYRDPAGQQEPGRAAALCCS